jgi:ubiquinone/menaquinone biosynthesis C-methylase UbiE
MEHQETVARRFDRWAPDYDTGRISRWFQFFQAVALAKIPTGEGFRFLDVGCGTGWAVRTMARRSKVSVSCGIDLSAQMIEKAKAASVGSDARIEFSIADVSDIPYPADHFDAVICTCSFHHHTDPMQSLSEMRRVLKSEGKLVIIDSARDVFFPIWVQDMLRRRFEKGHVRYYTTGEMAKMVRNAGLRQARELVTVKRFMMLKKVFTGLMIVECTKDTTERLP